MSSGGEIFFPSNFISQQKLLLFKKQYSNLSNCLILKIVLLRPIYSQKKSLQSTSAINLVKILPLILKETTNLAGFVLFIYITVAISPIIYVVPLVLLFLLSMYISTDHLFVTTFLFSDNIQPAFFSYYCFCLGCFKFCTRQRSSVDT